MPQHRRLQDRVAIVTGGARGIGEAIATRLASEGARVLIADIDGDVAAETARRIVQETGSDVTAQQTDVTNPAHSAAAIGAATARWGRLDILVNNAAILDVSAFNNLTYDRFSKVLRTNLDSVLICTVAAARFLAKSPCAPHPQHRLHHGHARQPQLAALQHGQGRRGQHDARLACDLADKGINVNAIAPGFIDTRMARMPDGSHEHETDWFKDIYLKYGRLPAGRAGKPDDIAGPAFFFCSDDSRYVTGQIMLVDGGVSATF